MVDFLDVFNELELISFLEKTYKILLGFNTRDSSWMRRGVETLKLQLMADFTECSSRSKNRLVICLLFTTVFLSQIWIQI